MHHLLRSLVVGALALTLASTTFASIELRLKDGTRWRGEVGDSIKLTILEQGVSIPFEGKIIEAKDLYLVVEGRLAGQTQKKTVFKSDIVKIQTAAAAAGTTARPAGAANDPKSTEQPAQAKSDGSESSPEVPSDKEAIAKADGSTYDPKTGFLVPPKPGVFVLPLEETVGEAFRHEEIDAIAKYADKYGPGQIIVLRINSNGGSSFESMLIAESIFEIKKTHRVVAWLEKAISAGCQTAMCCDEIYFMTEGTAGAVTTWNPGTGQSIKGEELERAMEDLANIAERAGHSRYIAYAMKTNKALLSYDKDPETGEVTWHNDMSGEFKLSDAKSNLSFNSSNALHCKFSDGTADTGPQLAKLLNLPEWYEISDYGRRIAKQWQDTVKKAQYEIPLLIARWDFKTAGTGDPVIWLGAHIQLLEQAISWHRRCPNVARGMLPPPDDLERMIYDLRKQLSDIKKAEQRRR